MTLVFLMPGSLGPAKSAARAEVLAEDLTRRLGEEVRVELGGSYEDMADRLQSGEVHLAWVPPKVCADVPAHVRFRIVRGGRADVRAALVVRTGEIRKPLDLAGSRAVWLDPSSAGGYLLARAWLRSQGFSLETLFAEQRFAGSYMGSLRALLEGSADVTSVYAHSEDPAEVRPILLELLGDRAHRLSALAVTGATSGDAIVVGCGLDLTHALTLAKRIEAVGPGSLFLEILEAERLERASPSAWSMLQDA